MKRKKIIENGKKAANMLAKREEKRRKITEKK